MTAAIKVVKPAVIFAKLAMEVLKTTVGHAQQEPSSQLITNVFNNVQVVSMDPISNAGSVQIYVKLVLLAKTVHLAALRLGSYMKICVTPNAQMESFKLMEAHTIPAAVQLVCT